MSHHRFGARITASVLSLALVTSGCATAAGGRLPATHEAAVDPGIMAEYVQKLPLGTTVRVDRANGRTVRGTLMKATAELLIVQPKTRLAVAPVEIPVAEVLRVAPDSNGGNSLGKAIAVGAATGAAAALGVIAILAAIFDD